VPVDQHLAGVGLGVVGLAGQPPAPPGPHQRLLGQVLGLGRVPGEQEAEPAQPLVVLGEEPPEVLVGRHASPSRCCRRHGRRATAARGFTEFRARGVKVEDYDLPGLKTTDRIADIGLAGAAWIIDPGNDALGILQLNEDVRHAGCLR
jgi:hypothetical protein